MTATWKEQIFREKKTWKERRNSICEIADKGLRLLEHYIDMNWIGEAYTNCVIRISRFPKARLELTTSDPMRKPTKIYPAFLPIPSLNVKHMWMWLSCIHCLFRFCVRNSSGGHAKTTGSTRESLKRTV